MNGLLQLEQRLNALLANISPKQRRQLAMKIGRQLAQSQRRRIKAQQNPDGSDFEPRKRQKERSKKGRIKQLAMFKKLGTARFMKTRSNADQVSIVFSGSNATIANVHQYGLHSRVRKDRDYKIKYAQRELLGFTDYDLEVIEKLVYEGIANV
jgi:phage virion morphogenesis protein